MTDLAEMGSLSFKNEGVEYLLGVIDVFTKYDWVKPLKDKKGKTVLNVFIEIVNISHWKPNKLWVDQGREFYNKLIQERLDDNDISIYLTHKAGKSVIAKRFIKTLKGEIYQRMTAKDSKFYISYLNKLVDQYNNTYHHYTGKKPIDAHYSALTEKLRRILKLLNLKSMIWWEVLSITTFVVKITMKIDQQKYLLLTLCWKTILGCIKLKIYDNLFKIIWRFMKKSCCCINYKWVIIRNQIVILEIKSK